MAAIGRGCRRLRKLRLQNLPRVTAGVLLPMGGDLGLESLEREKALRGVVGAAADVACVDIYE